MRVRFIRSSIFGVPTGPETVERLHADIGDVFELPDDYAAKLIASGAAIDDVVADDAERIAGDVENELAERAMALRGPRVIEHATGKEPVLGGYVRRS